MADHHEDPFERELTETFRPAPMSLELREKIGTELSHRPLRRFAAVAGALAACVALVVLVWRGRDVTDTPIGQTAIVQAPIESSAPPTLIDYQRAFAKSSESLESLLARPAGGATRTSDSPAEPVRAFSRSFNGESL
jgi:hypothetical protein